MRASARVARAIPLKEPYRRQRRGRLCDLLRDHRYLALHQRAIEVLTALRSGCRAGCTIGIDRGCDQGTTVIEFGDG